MNQVGNRKHSSPRAVLSAGSTSTYTTGIGVNTSNRGKWGVILTNQTTQATPVVDSLTGAAFPVLHKGYGTVVVMGLTAAGAIAACQGTIVPLLDATTYAVCPQFPPMPEDFVPIGYYTIKNSTAGADWTFGAGYWNAGGITVVAVDCDGALPDRPPT